MVSIRTYYFLPASHQQYAIIIPFMLPSINGSVPSDSFTPVHYILKSRFRPHMGKLTRSNKSISRLLSVRTTYPASRCSRKNPAASTRSPDMCEWNGHSSGKSTPSVLHYCPTDKMVADLLTKPLGCKARNLHSAVIFSGSELWGECRIITT